jgi:predicted TIM-barrel fold metal-dependent hydrolase
MHARLGIARMVIVQASPHGSDNRCMLDALDQLGGQGRGVVVLGDAVDSAQLRSMHARGVRGVRVNLETSGKHDPVHARNALLNAAERVADLGWHVQTFTNLSVFRQLVDILPSLPAPLVIDHFAKAQASLGCDQPGFLELCDAMAQGYVYVKLSAPYRISNEPDYADAAPLAKALIKANPDRVVWGSDWPHPGSAAGAMKPVEQITPFRNENNVSALARAMSWTSSDTEWQKLSSFNAFSLYDFETR